MYSTDLLTLPGLLTDIHILKVSDPLPQIVASDEWCIRESVYGKLKISACIFYILISLRQRIQLRDYLPDVYHEPSFEHWTNENFDSTVRVFTLLNITKFGTYSGPYLYGFKSMVDAVKFKLLYGNP